MLGACAECESGLGKGFMGGAEWATYLPDDPEPEDAYADNYDASYVNFTYGTEGLGFTLPEVGGGGGFDFGGGGSGGFSVLSPGYSDCDPSQGTDPITGDVCVGSGGQTIPASGGGGGGSTPGGGGGSTNWASIIQSLSNLGQGIARAATGQQGPTGYRITGYTPQGQPIYGGVSGGVSLGPSGATGSLGISNTTLLIGAVVIGAFLLGGRKR